MTPQPSPPPPSPAEAAREARALLDQAAGRLEVVRRYREGPSPLVRDSVHGWRTGRADRVLDGDFDLFAASLSAG